MQIEYLKHLANLDDKLSQLDEDGLNKLYLRCFNSDDGQFVLRDLANRCCVEHSTIGKTEYNEGMRSVYLTIQTRLSNAVSGKKKEDSNV